MPSSSSLSTIGRRRCLMRWTVWSSASSLYTGKTFSACRCTRNTCSECSFSRIVQHRERSLSQTGYYLLFIPQHSGPCLALHAEHCVANSTWLKRQRASYMSMTQPSLIIIVLVETDNIVRHSKLCQALGRWHVMSGHIKACDRVHTRDLNPRLSSDTSTNASSSSLPSSSSFCSGPLHVYTRCGRLRSSALGLSNCTAISKVAVDCLSTCHLIPAQHPVSLCHPCIVIHMQTLASKLGVIHLL